ncbi:MAG: hypothetical protein P8I45_07910, partial [Nitrospinaceae bacterium]|nr:hypothetical protein [Nitrospinaceae bacterium]
QAMIQLGKEYHKESSKKIPEREEALKKLSNNKIGIKNCMGEVIRKNLQLLPHLEMDINSGPLLV